MTVCNLYAGMLTEIERFSKHVHGVATLFQDMVQALPYWVDDDSVRASMLNSAPEQPVEVAVTYVTFLSLAFPVSSILILAFERKII